MSNIKNPQKTTVGISGGLIMNHKIEVSPIPHHHYDVECFGSDGILKWRESFDNIVMTTGKNWYLQQGLVSAVASPLMYVGLVGTRSWSAYAAADTQPSHAGWVEVGTVYSNGTRVQWNPGAVASGTVDNSASKAVFAITASEAVRGGFMTTGSNKGNPDQGSLGTIIGAGDFSLIRTVISGDTLNVTVTCTMS